MLDPSLIDMLFKVSVIDTKEKHVIAGSKICQKGKTNLNWHISPLSHIQQYTRQNTKSA
jgi:hypothetical protein